MFWVTVFTSYTEGTDPSCFTPPFFYCSKNVIHFSLLSLFSLNLKTFLPDFLLLLHCTINSSFQARANYLVILGSVSALPDAISFTLVYEHLKRPYLVERPTLLIFFSPNLSDTVFTSSSVLSRFFSLSSSLLRFLMKTSSSITPTGNRHLDDPKQILRTKVRL